MVALTFVGCFAVGGGAVLIVLGVFLLQYALK